MKFEVGERVQVIRNGVTKEGTIKKLEGNNVSVDTEDNYLRTDISLIAKLDQPEPVKVPEQVSKLLDTYLITKEPLDDFSKGTILADILDDYSEGVLAKDWEIADNWIGDNRTKLKDAVRNGYVVEEEHKYYVKLPIEYGFLNCSKANGICSVNNKKEDALFKTKFTETEIKAIDERLWAFAVPVEEVEAE